MIFSITLSNSIIPLEVINSICPSNAIIIFLLCRIFFLYVLLFVILLVSNESADTTKISSFAADVTLVIVFSFLKIS